ncbi:MAG: stage 0 sporulation protein [Candidatus Schekmanbacteria bacterium]|nr:stage 0 sporulation protein [Candidatus Schekmanbacteria bacterium]
MSQLLAVDVSRAEPLYFSSPADDVVVKSGDVCIIKTGRHTQLGRVVGPVKPCAAEAAGDAEISTILRLATEQDLERHRENADFEKRAVEVVLDCVQECQLVMKLVRVRYTLDRAKAIVYFTAEQRVDFRALVRQLAYRLRVRIEMRQIGPRDEVRELGALGCCGLVTCCCSFLHNFEPVSMRMAKWQNLSLVPKDLSGVCGRLKCCIRYEAAVYKELMTTMPPLGAMVETPTRGKGTVRRHGSLNGTVTVELDQDGSWIELPCADVKVAMPAPAPVATAGDCQGRQDPVQEEPAPVVGAPDVPAELPAATPPAGAKRTSRRRRRSTAKVTPS